MDRPIKPYSEVKGMLGASSGAWEKLVGHARFNYIVDEQWREGKPTHKNYNDLYIRCGGKSLIMFAIREGYFMACVVLGKDERAKFEEQRETFGEAIGKVYDEAETYHDGKWLGFDIYDDSLVDDIIRLLHLKRKPNRKVLPESLEVCGRLDLGLSKEDITNAI
ncbi:MAG: DUF3788 domain-containing protein [Defluviitaleaceae bacterium]|nr:DUF3788 domain-containing protein [Defluviitaleaceae bacterium]